MSSSAATCAILSVPRSQSSPRSAAWRCPHWCSSLFNLGGSLRGWAIPTATDIAFALAVLAVIGSHLPSGLRTFLLTLAVVDDLIAIIIIAVVYTSSLHLNYLLLALLPLVAFTVLVQRRIQLVVAAAPARRHHLGAGARLRASTPPSPACCWPSRSRAPSATAATASGLAEHFEHRFRPLSAAVAVPIFAFFAAGVHVEGWTGFTDAMTEPITLGIIAGLFVGKTVGVFGATWLMATFTGAELDDDLDWPDVLGVAMLAGVGFTVSLLIGELAYGVGNITDEHVKIGVLVGSVDLGPAPQPSC